MTHLISAQSSLVKHLSHRYHVLKSRTGTLCHHKNKIHLTHWHRNDLKTPDLIYIPQVMRWVKTKIGFKLLQKGWDPEFSEGAFIYGTTRAICRVTGVISRDDEDNELRKLVTQSLYRKLESDMRLQLTDLQKKIIALKPDDIKLLIPLHVRLEQRNERKIAQVLLRALAVKWQNLNENMRLAIVALQTEFIRDYTDLDFSEWTMNIFDILECGIVGQPRTPKIKRLFLYRHLLFLSSC